MDQKRAFLWGEGLIVNLVSNLVSICVGAAVTYFTHAGSTWVKPVLAGGGAWLITFSSILAVRIMRSIPRRSTPLTVDNIEAKLRYVFDKFSLAVQAIHDEENYFFFIVTTDGQKKISVSRQKGQFSDYLLIKGLITATAQDEKVLESFTEEERLATALALKLELSRAVMGHITDNIFKEVTVFKRIPITSSLGEEDILNVLWRIEAMILSLYNVAALATYRYHILKEKKADETGVPRGPRSPEAI